MKLLLVLTVAAAAAPQGRSPWVYPGDDGRLRYGTDARGIRIMDLSHAGYGGGGVRLPDVRAVRTLSPEPGDNTARIQSAIDEVSALAAGADGFRGAIVLNPGVYEVAGPLRIAASGVVLRGSGSGDGGTVVRVTGEPHRFLDICPGTPVSTGWVLIRSRTPIAALPCRQLAWSVRRSNSSAV